MAKMVIDYDYIYNMSTKMTEYSDKYNDIVTKIKTNNTNVHNEWTSDNSDSIFTKIEEVTADMDKELNYMRNYASLLKDISENFVSEDTKLATEVSTSTCYTLKGEVKDEQ